MCSRPDEREVEVFGLRHTEKHSLGTVVIFYFIIFKSV